MQVDPVRFRQIVTNLLNTAAMYAPMGGRIDLVASADAQEVGVQVRDTGIGLAPNQAT